MNNGCYQTIFIPREFELSGSEAMRLYEDGYGGNTYMGSTVSDLSDTTMQGVNSLNEAGANWNTGGTRDLYAGLGEAARETLADCAPMSIAGSLFFAAANLVHPRMLWLMLWPMLVSLALWGAVAIALWTRAAIWLAGVLERWLESAMFFVELDLAGAALIAAHVVLFLLFVPLVYLTAVFILSLFGMQKMVEHVAGRSFSALERRRGGGVAGSGWNALVAFLGMLGLGVASLPLWLLPPLWPLIPIAILGWVNQRLLRYDALAEHADPQEMARLFREQRASLYLLGVLMALTAYIPVVGLVAPVLFGLAFIHYLLGALNSSRLSR